MSAHAGGIEHKIESRRGFFNNAVQELNTAVQSFPAVLFARQMGFHEREFFKLDEGERAAVEAPPQVKF